MKWGVRNGPPYPIEENKKVAKVRRHDNLVEEAIHSGEVSKLSLIHISEPTRRS